MTRFAILVLLLAAAPAQAITWNFDTDGDTQGWFTWDGSCGLAINCPRLQSEVRDGIWRIDPVPTSDRSPDGRPCVAVVSPRIGRDSALYDRVRMRVRVVHRSPFKANLVIDWLNAFNAQQGAPGLSVSIPGAEVSQLEFTHWVEQTYTTQWQEVQIGLASEDYVIDTPAGAVRVRMVWEGELLQLAARLFLNRMSSPADLPDAVEIDWIQLTGIEEQMQGEGLPPGHESPGQFGALFAAPVFSPLRGGISSPYWVPMAALGDLDGDGHPDLLARWEDPDLSPGWLSALNDGQGQFRTGQTEPLGQPLAVGGADLDGDGLMDLVLRDSAGLKVLHNRAEEGFVPTALDPDAWYLGVGDAEGDGDVDLWTYRASDGKVTEAVLQRNDGMARFQPVSLGQDLAAQGFVPFELACPVSQGHNTGLLWVSVGDPGKGYQVTYLDARGDWVQQHLATSVSPLLVRYVGDFDRDGDVDMVVSDKESSVGYTGVRFLVNAGDGQLQPVTWNEEAILASDVSFLDLNHDPWLDMVFVDTRLEGPAVVVALGQEHGLPVQEGRYPLQGPGGLVLGGDVDGDGDVDLVVLEKAYTGGGGGVHVLLNQWVERNDTAITTELASIPAGFHLGPNYPNPFNPQTWIPLKIPADTESARLQVYDLLGQPIRTLVSGHLTAGYHAVPWDGRDESGATVSSGVYLYRLEAGSSNATGRMVKSQ